MPSAHQQVVSRPLTKSLTSATNSIELVGDADKVKEVKEEAEDEASRRKDGKSRVALHLFESQSAPSSSSSNPLGNVGGWQRSVESGATAPDVDEDGRVMVPEDGLYLLYAQECISCPTRGDGGSQDRPVLNSISLRRIESHIIYRASLPKVRYRADKRHGPTNAYEVYQNAEPILTCSKSAESASEQSCFTARILMARRGQIIK